VHPNAIKKGKGPVRWQLNRSVQIRLFCTAAQAAGRALQGVADKADGRPAAGRIGGISAPAAALVAGVKESGLCTACHGV
tara:strand:- start:236 stop:475 length:240 start_codon:yes stop_codon:yes gene_type:complete